MRRSGFVLTEIIVSILLFSIGIVALSGAIAVSLKMIVDSGMRIQQDQDVVNSYEKYIRNRITEHSGGPKDFLSGSAQVTKQNDGIIQIGNASLNYIIYKVGLKDKKGGELFVLQKK